METENKKGGVARIKPEYIVQDYVRELNLNFVTDADQEKVNKDAESKNGPPKKKLKGQNKRRPHMEKAPKADKMCHKIAVDGFCQYGDNCCYSHDVASYLKNKPPDIGDSCYLYETHGKCPCSFSCRFGSSHLNDGKNLINEGLWNETKDKVLSINGISNDIKFLLRKKKYDFKKSNEILESWNKLRSEQVKSNKEIPPNSHDAKPIGAVIDDNLQSLPNKKIDFKNKLFLAPLTTVGNLPFRRICKEFGVDVTCSEMALATSLLQGNSSEWALLKRHHAEDIFGIQLCGAHPDIMTRCSQVLSETISFDFIDLNLGCPIDGIVRKGAGSGLLGRWKKLEGIIYGISSAIDVPLTLKMRTGLNENYNITHNIIKKINHWKDRVSLITLHGRSAEQRYTKLANWGYIDECSKLAEPITFFGNGDILSYEDYYARQQETNVAGIMIGRAAIIKPWIFQEIKERRHWDISSSERFEILKKYTNYGLEHWGSDTEGVERTRRFLLEWLSFLYRYIPVGLLEQVPQRINERPPRYVGRDEMETLMASSSCQDWIKISEKLLGPVPENFTFLPKHKANAYQ